MVAWFKKEAGGGAAAGGTGLIDGALDTLASLLKTFAHHAVELEAGDHQAFVRHCEAWGRHVLTGTPVADDETEKDREEDEAARPGLARDWNRLRVFFRERRRQEANYVNHTLSDLRGIIWDFVAGLREVAGNERTAEARIQGSLAELERATKAESIAGLRAAVGEAVGAIKGALDTQRHEFDQQMRVMGKRLAQMRDDLVETRRQLEVDPLTKIYNRGAFDSSITRVVNLATFTGQPLLLLFIDLDHFKAVNDNHGHQTGDQVLKAVADTIVRCFPRRNDFVARYGGEEFVVVLFDVIPEDAPRLAARLLERIRALAIATPRGPLAITCSLGYTALGSDDTPESLLQRADAALYRAKQGGRDRAEAG